MQNIDSAQPDAWAKLVPLSLSPDSKNWALTKDSCTVGKAITNDIQVVDHRVDAIHYRIFKEANDTGKYYWIENLSCTGVVVEDKVINNKNKHRLLSGDKIGFVFHSEMKSEIVQTHIFYLTSKENEGLKGKGMKQLEENNECDKLKSFYDNHNLECSICLFLIYNCATVQPCLHNFCASCISTWILESKVCPNCKQEYTNIRKNPILNEMINSFREMNPELKESKEYYDKKDEKDRIKALFEVVTFSGGTIYEGEWVNGRKEGKGKMRFAEGHIYEGDWINNKREGKGKIIYAEGHIYEGDWVKARREGKGKMTYAEGHIYEGDWVKDQREGKGKMIFPAGHIYEGDWINNNREGKGKIIYAEGHIYEGNWINNKREGKGKMIFAEGHIYEGDWINNKREGKGKIIYAEGHIYEGDWINDIIEGKGKAIYSDGRVYEGDWVNNRWEGKGKMRYVEGHIYEGDWVNNNKEGKGKMIYADGAIYEGDWVNDMKETKNIYKEDSKL